MKPRVRPILTEKSIQLAGRGWFTFSVDPHWNKKQIGNEIQTLYKVTVDDVRTSMRHGKERRVGRKQLKVRQPDTKRALVRLPSGQTIPAFEISPEVEKK